ncbi:MAG: hypothetical protein A2176_04655 [Spirochaetes bacterium RBG_13_51_14]|nr:MAG: hypothetical protein A2176_04655 [Spirochaetes bacterium RBG_13_51_14]
MKKNTIFIASVSAIFLCTGATFIFSQDTVNDIIINKRGVELGESKQLDEAIKEFDKAINIRDRAAAKVYHNKAYSLEQKGEMAEAIKNYEQAWKRNPRQIVTGERLGHAYYKTEDYERAIEVGEAVLKIDPQNKNVPPWLEDAYKKRAGKKQKPEVTKQEELKQEPEEQHYYFYMTVDAMMRTGLFYGRKYHHNELYYTTPHGYRFVTDHGLIVDVPESIFLRIAPVPLLQINVTVEKPWLGGAMPNFIEQSQMLEILFRFKKVQFGAGVMFNEYDSDAAFYRRYKLWDTKVGFIFGYKKDKVEAKFTWYPRMLIMDPRSSTGKTLDVGMFRMDYTYQALPNIRVHALVLARDYYVFCHSFDWRVFYASYYHYSQDIADYWGVYDLGLGFTFNNLVNHADGSELFSLTFEWLERFYLRDLENDNPYTLAPNGQGWFGLNLQKFTKGKPFSGFRSLSQVLSLRLNEQITRNFFMYQKVIVELADQDSEHHEFNLQVGMGVKF